MKKLLALISIAYCLAFTSQVTAQPYEYETTEQEDPGFYVGAFGGTNWAHLKEHHHVKGKFKMGYVGAVSLGYKFDNGFRVEGEIAYRRNKLKSFSIKDSFGAELSLSDFRASGHTSTTSYMANILYDFDFGYCLTPYIGAGIGYADVHASAHSKDFPQYKASESSKGFAAQGIVGVSYALCEKTSIGVEYRYFKARENVDDQSVGIALRRSF